MRKLIASGASIAMTLALTACSGSARSETLSNDSEPVSTQIATATATHAEIAVATSTPTAAGRAATPVVARGEACESDPNPVFTAHYTDPELIDFINPTIVTSGNWLKNRQYHKVVTDAENNAPEVPIYAPVDAVATEVTHYLGQMMSWDGEPFELAQFDIRFRVSCEVSFTFDHVSRLAEPFASLAATEPSRDTRDAAVRMEVAVEAGQLIGYSSGTEPAHVWDFLVWNKAERNQFANQERYEQSAELETLLHAVCPWDYYPPELAVEYTSRFGGWQGRAPDVGCNLEPDVAGTVAGGWFASPYDDSDQFRPVDWGLVASLAGDGYLDVNGPSRALRVAVDEPTFLGPSELTGEHCYQHYQSPAQWVYVALQPDGTLAAAFGDGLCPPSLPDEHQIFHR